MSTEVNKTNNAITTPTSTSRKRPLALVSPDSSHVKSGEAIIGDNSSCFKSPRVNSREDNSSQRNTGDQVHNVTDTTDIHSSSPPLQPAPTFNISPVVRAQSPALKIPFSWNWKSKSEEGRVADAQDCHSNAETVVNFEPATKEDKMADEVTTGTKRAKKQEPKTSQQTPPQGTSSEKQNVDQVKPISTNINRNTLDIEDSEHAASQTLHRNSAIQIEKCKSTGLFKVIANWPQYTIDTFHEAVELCRDILNINTRAATIATHMNNTVSVADVTQILKTITQNKAIKYAARNLPPEMIMKLKPFMKMVPKGHSLSAENLAFQLKKQYTVQQITEYLQIQQDIPLILIRNVSVTQRTVPAKRIPDKHISKPTPVWTDDKDETLRNAILQYGYAGWIKVSEVVNQSVGQCQSRFKYNKTQQCGKWKNDQEMLIAKVNLLYRCKARRTSMYKQKTSTSTSPVAPMGNKTTVSVIVPEISISPPQLPSSSRSVLANCDYDNTPNDMNIGDMLLDRGNQTDNGNINDVSDHISQENACHISDDDGNDIIIVHSSDSDSDSSSSESDYIDNNGNDLSDHLHREKQTNDQTPEDHGFDMIANNHTCKQSGTVEPGPVAATSVEVLPTNMESTETTSDTSIATDLGGCDPNTEISGGVAMTLEINTETAKKTTVNTIHNTNLLNSNSISQITTCAAVSESIHNSHTPQKTSPVAVKTLSIFNNLENKQFRKALLTHGSTTSGWHKVSEEIGKDISTCLMQFVSNKRPGGIWEYDEEMQQMQLFASSFISNNSTAVLSNRNHILVNESTSNAVDNKHPIKKVGRAVSTPVIVDLTEEANGVSPTTKQNIQATVTTTTVATTTLPVLPVCTAMPSHFSTEPTTTPDSHNECSCEVSLLSSEEVMDREMRTSDQTKDSEWLDPATIATFMSVSAESSDSMDTIVTTAVVVPVSEPIAATIDINNATDLSISDVNCCDVEDDSQAVMVVDDDDSTETEFTPTFHQEIIISETSAGEIITALIVVPCGVEVPSSGDNSSDGNSTSGYHDVCIGSDMVHNIDDHTSDNENSGNSSDDYAYPISCDLFEEPQLLPSPQDIMSDSQGTRAYAVLSSSNIVPEGLSDRSQQFYEPPLPPRHQPSPLFAAVNHPQPVVVSEPNNCNQLSVIVSKIATIYRQYNPSKLSKIPVMLHEYKGHEELLLAKIENKYVYNTGSNNSTHNVHNNSVTVNSTNIHNNGNTVLNYGDSDSMNSNTSNIVTATAIAVSNYDAATLSEIAADKQLAEQITACWTKPMMSLFVNALKLYPDNIEHSTRAACIANYMCNSVTVDNVSVLLQVWDRKLQRIAMQRQLQQNSNNKEKYIQSSPAFQYNSNSSNGRNSGSSDHLPCEYVTIVPGTISVRQQPQPPQQTMKLQETVSQILNDDSELESEISDDGDGAGDDDDVWTSDMMYKLERAARIFPANNGSGNRYKAIARLIGNNVTVREVREQMKLQGMIQQKQPERHKDKQQRKHCEPKQHKDKQRKPRVIMWTHATIAKFRESIAKYNNMSNGWQLVSDEMGLSTKQCKGGWKYLKKMSNYEDLRSSIKFCSVWTQEMHAKLREALITYRNEGWCKISEIMGRSVLSCMNRFQRNKAVGGIWEHDTIIQCLRIKYRRNKLKKRKHSSRSGSSVGDSSVDHIKNDIIGANNSNNSNNNSDIEEESCCSDDDNDNDNSDSDGIMFNNSNKKQKLQYQSKTTSSTVNPWLALINMKNSTNGNNNSNNCESVQSDSDLESLLCDKD